VTARRLRKFALGLVAVVAMALATTRVAAPDVLTRASDYVSAWVTKDVGAPTGGTVPERLSENDPPSVRLAAAGDVGTGSSAEQATADAMALAGTARPFDALLLLGDNVYPSGDPAKVQDVVLDPFAVTLDTGAELLAVLGNHDVMDDNGDDQAAALGMPGRWYARQLGPVLIIGLDSTRADDPAQTAWLDQTLAAATAPWKIVTMHHPMYSAGWHGSSEGVRAAFQPSFDRYGVQLVLAGHDHDYQRSRPINGVTYIVSGAGAKLRRTGRASFTEASWSALHFLDIAVWEDRMTVQAIGQDGLVYDSTTLTRGRAPG
jgi:hypothetical protein